MKKTSPKNHTCNDGIQNQDETDVDCGGVCSTCQNELTDVEIVTADVIALSGTNVNDFLSGNDLDSNAVTTNLTLPFAGENGSLIYWKAIYFSDGVGASKIIAANGPLHKMCWVDCNYKQKCSKIYHRQDYLI